MRTMPIGVGAVSGKIEDEPDQFQNRYDKRAKGNRAQREGGGATKS